MNKIETRVWTALVGIPVVFFFVWAGDERFGFAVNGERWNVPLFRGFCLVLAVLALRELQRGIQLSGDYGRARIVGEVAYPATIYALCFGLSALWAISTAFTLGILAVALGGREEGRRVSLASLCTTLFCTLYVSLFALLPSLRGPLNGKWFWLVLLCVWAGDTFAYYGGKRFGKRLLSPLSPKKTREGFLIGIFAAGLTAPLLAHFLNLPLNSALLLGFVVGLAAPVGDLFESFLKRELGVKDLGTLFPGHGGVLDRCDSLLYAAFAALLVLGAR